MSEDLSIERAVSRFFLAAPLFGVVAGAIIAANGSSPLIDRFQPLSYALTHIVAIGLISMIAIGALFLALAASAASFAVKRFSSVVFFALNIGVLALCYGFIAAEPIGFTLGGVAFFLSLIPFAVTIIYKLYRLQDSDSSIWLIRLALIGLAITVLLGAHLSLERCLQPADQASVTLSDLHLSWGFVMWISLLIMSVSRRFLPLLYATPPYPKICCQIGVPLLYFTLIILSFFVLLSIDRFYVALVVKICAAAVLTTFGVISLIRTRRRERGDEDPSFWRFSMCCLIASAPFLFIEGERYDAMFAILFIGGFVLSFINAAVYKVMPFFSHFNLERTAAIDTLMRDSFISKNAMRLQMIFHIASIVCLAIGILYDPLSRVGGGLFTIGYILIFKDTLSVVLRRKLASA
ncbi:MAG: hypothetical protein LBF86_07790 [Helicobacteraceae bacterium]|jgi:hypothetical protein|nr:hypothetical protein [Helicobacteraceae bacterium]